MNERYLILKKLYPNYLILIKVKDKIKLLGIDKKIVDMFGIDNLKNVNKLILDNLDIVKKEEYENNKYDIYYLKIRLIDLLNEIRSCLNEKKIINS